MKKSLGLIVALCLVAMLTTACNRYEDKIVGTWKLDYWMTYSQFGSNGDAVEDCFFTFNKGGKGFMTAPSNDDGDVLTTEFTYSIDGDDLRMSLRDFEHNTIEKLDDNKMLLTQLAATSSTEFGFTKIRN